MAAEEKKCEEAKEIVGKAEFVGKLAESLGKSKKETAEIVNAFLETLKEQMAQGRCVRLIPFGNFGVAVRNQRNANRPSDGARIVIPAHVVPVFKPGKALKEAVKVLDEKKDLA